MAFWSIKSEVGQNNINFKNSNMYLKNIKFDYSIKFTEMYDIIFSVSVTYPENVMKFDHHIGL